MVQGWASRSDYILLLIQIRMWIYDQFSTPLNYYGMVRCTLIRKRAPLRFSATLQQPWRRFALSEHLVCICEYCSNITVHGLYRQWLSVIGGEIQYNRNKFITRPTCQFASESRALRWRQKQLRVARFKQFSFKPVLKCQKRISWTAGRGHQESSRL